LERTSISLPISVEAADLDAFETLSVVITGVPADSRLSAGTKMADGSWVLSPDQLAGLAIWAPHEGTIALTVTAIATEVKSQRQAASTASVTIESKNVDFTLMATASGSAIVRQYATDGTPIRAINAFPGFRGGVTVAAADLNGDDVPDIIVGAASVTSHVRAFDGANGAMIRNFLAFPGYPGGVTVAASGPTALAMSLSHVEAVDGATGKPILGPLSLDADSLVGIWVG
jgi:hypothetical protein